MRGQNVGKIDAWAKIIAPWAEKKTTRAKIVGKITCVRGQNHEMRGQNHQMRGQNVGKIYAEIMCKSELARNT